MQTKAQSRHQSKRMQYFSRLAGSFEPLPIGDVHKVRFRPVAYQENAVYRNWTRLVSYGALVLQIIFCAILLQPGHWLIRLEPESSLRSYSLIMLICLSVLQLFIIIGTLAATRSTMLSRNPVPVTPQRRLKVAFVTTRAPGEPVAMVRKTLTAIKRVAYQTGTVDAWLLDETNSSELQLVCSQLNVRYFSRAGVKEWNTAQHYPKYLQYFAHYIKLILPFNNRPTDKYLVKPNTFLAAKSKHGNFNSWFEHLKQEGISYDILAGVDTDQVPEPNYLERLLGYFRDADVAYAVGPQVYGNFNPGLSGLVARWAESQASFFQSTVQRAGNASHSSMFVGTNYAVRMTALAQIGGFQPCITEDMATGLAIHARRNPATGNRWQSVYTPDVLAIGEGPEYWGPFFTQQWRWAAGTFDTWRRMAWRVIFKLPPRAMLHYFLMLTYYPMTALAWLLAVASSLIYLTTGATAILAPWAEFISLYTMTLILQMSLYFWNRRYNVSPHEARGTLGIPGIFLSILTAPIYLSALFGILLGKKVNFQVTSKGESENPDWFATYKIHLSWAGVMVVGLVYGVAHGHHHPAMLLWAVSLLVISVIPIVLGMSQAIPARFKNTLLVGEVTNA